MAKLFKIIRRNGKKSAHWYGKIRLAPQRWQRVALFTDKVASERRLAERQRDADQRAAGVQTTQMDHAAYPIQQHSADYIGTLRLEKRDSETIRIAQWTMDRLLEWGKWQRIADLRADSMRGILSTLDRQGKTASYQNKFIMRAKAFVHWLQREGRISADPLANLKRVDERNGKRTRARRALTDAEVTALLEAAPEDRREKYAWATLAGMRRSELRELRWGDLRLNAPRPFVQLRPEQTKNGKADVLPIHPYLLKLLGQRSQGMPETPVVSSVPDMKTVVKDFNKAGVVLVDARGRRVDYHSLRHTFCTNLDRTGCSFTTKRALMRHSDTGVTEGYSHARLNELYTAIERLPSPDGAAQQTQIGKAVGAETNPKATRIHATMTPQDFSGADHLEDQTSVTSGQFSASTGIHQDLNDLSCRGDVDRYNADDASELHQSATIGNDDSGVVLAGDKTRPSTQAD
jgi:integrase